MNDKEQLKEINTFAPSWPHTKQLEVLKELDSGTRFVMIRAGRKWRKTSLMISWLFEKAIETGLSQEYCMGRSHIKNYSRVNKTRCTL
jgi:hypothetical protein